MARFKVGSVPEMDFTEATVKRGFLSIGFYDFYGLMTRGK